MLSFQSLQKEFETRLTNQAGKPYSAKSVREAVDITNGIIKQAGKGSSGAAPIKLVGGLEDLADKIESTYKFSENKRESKALEIISGLDVGITKADYGVAETGSIVEISYDDNLRLLSSLPRVHIAILENSAILPDIATLAPIIRSASQKKPVPDITLIGGPSRTSDIEMKSVLGVHGPHEVHVVIIER